MYFKIGDFWTYIYLDAAIASGLDLVPNEPLPISKGMLFEPAKD